MKAIYNKIYGDKVIWGITIFLSLMSILLIYVATDDLVYTRGRDTPSWYFAFKHGFIILLGFGLIYLIHLVKYSYFSRISQILLIISIPLLIFTMFAGQNINHAERWIKIPIINLSFQTSDLAKVALIIYLARILSKKQEILDDFKEVLKYIFAPVIGICALIVKSDFSTAALIFGICIIIMFFGGVKLKHIGIVIGAAVGIFALAILISPETFDRLTTWESRLSGDNDYQRNLASAAILDGGIMGSFFTGSNYPDPPQAASDFVFATLVKSFGVVGGFLTVALYLWFLFRSIKIARKSKKVFASLLVIGLSFSFVLQAFSNMAVAVGIFPVTGQPLPMVSMGGTSIWFACLSIGIILSVSREALDDNNPNPDLNESPESSS